MKHMEAPRPFVDFIEPVADPDEHVQYTLKIGPNGLVALLVKPENKSMITSGPLIVWSWRSGSCRGVSRVMDLLTLGLRSNTRSRTGARLRLSD